MQPLLDAPLASPPSLAAPLTWPRELAFRLRHLFLLKAVGITAFTWLFFIGYFHLLRHPIHAPIVMPLTALDRLVPFTPQALGAYLSLWVYVGTAPSMQRSFAELIVYGFWVGGLCLTGLALFYFWPTQIPPLGIDVSGIPGFKTLQGVDAAGNACPSMHVAVAMFTFVRSHDVLRRIGAPAWLRAINLLWFLAIALSTLAVKQHVAIDFAAGALLGLAFALPSLRWRPASERMGRVVRQEGQSISHRH